MSLSIFIHAFVSITIRKCGFTVTMSLFSFVSASFIFLKKMQPKLWIYVKMTFRLGYMGSVGIRPTLKINDLLFTDQPTISPDPIFMTTSKMFKGAYWFGPVCVCIHAIICYASFHFLFACFIWECTRVTFDGFRIPYYGPEWLEIGSWTLI